MPNGIGREVETFGATTPDAQNLLRAREFAGAEHHPETGEVIDPQAGNSSPQEIKPTDPKPAALPTFDINDRIQKLNTAAGVKAASAELIRVLEAHPLQDRASVPPVKPRSNLQ